MKADQDGQQTRFFKSTLGVFQGGGCRAAAFAGAYEVAVRRGVRFTEVAGTSAGALVAALIGAGASPEELLEWIQTIDFKRFTSPPERLTQRPIWARVASINEKLGRLADLYFDVGWHSSAYIEEWLEFYLRKLLPAANTPVSFRDLPLPTWVVATDVSGRKVRIWSSSDTPDDPVARAVRASCAIPVFFQPVDKRYFDGGVLSNLPTFVFKRDSHSERPLSSRIIAFALKSSDSRTQHPLMDLLDTVVDGAQQLQLNIQGRVPLMSIPTGDVRATDFLRMTPDLVKNLIENGRTAAQQFFDAELGVAREAQSTDRMRYGDQEFYAAVVQDAETTSTLYIAETDTDFVYSLFPTLLYWRLRNIPITALLARDEPSHHGPYRRRLLQLLGIRVIEVDRLPLRAYIANAGSPPNARAVVGMRSSTSLGSISGVVYEGLIDEYAIDALDNQLKHLTASGNERPLMTDPVRFEEVRPSDIVKGLRRVRQYSGSDIGIELRSVPVEKLVSLSRFVREYKYRQIDLLHSTYGTSSLTAFGPAQVALGDGRQTTLVTPPVVEQNGDQFILIEGTTRATYLRDHASKELVCFVIRGVSDPLPAEPVAFSRVRVVSKSLDATDRYEDFKYGRFRHIESSVRPIDSLG